jgi:ribosomal protein S10
MNSKNNEGGPINLFNREEKIYVRFKLSENKDKWERWVSKTKKDWVKTHQALTLEEVVRFQEEIVNDNFKKFFKFIAKK